MVLCINKIILWSVKFFTVSTVCSCIIIYRMLNNFKKYYENLKNQGSDCPLLHNRYWVYNSLQSRFTALNMFNKCDNFLWALKVEMLTKFVKIAIICKLYCYKKLINHILIFIRHTRGLIHFTDTNVIIFDSQQNYINI